MTTRTVGLYNAEGLIVDKVILQQGSVWQPPEGLSVFNDENAEIGDSVVDGQLVKVVTLPDFPALLKSYRDQKAETYTYKGVPLTLKDGQRADLSALYFSVLIDQNIPNSQVMAEWQEPGYDTLNITAGDLRTDGQTIFNHRQKCFTAYNAIKNNEFTTIEQMEGAFDTAYNQA